MSLVSSSIPNLISGVSQQPYALRLASQAEAQVNGFSDVANGLSKRPPTHHVARFLDAPLTNAFLHTIDRDQSERYVTVFTDQRVRAFRLDGSEVTVNAPDGLAYLASSNPASDIGVVTVADYSFVVNKAVTVGKAPETLPASRYEALVWVRQGNYSTNYTVTVAGQSVTHTTNTANAASDAASIQTDLIAFNLGQKLIAALGAGGQSGFQVTQLGSTLHVFHETVDFAISTSDSQGDTALKLVHKVVQSFTDLPARAVPGFRCAVVTSNNSDNAFTQYYTVYDADSTNPNGGVWKEAAKGGEQYRLDPATMPHILVREADGTFTFKAAAWAERDVGDLDIVPYPSFEGRRINDVFFFKNRLGLLADENIIFSRAGEFFNFFRASAIQTVDSDPIDVAVAFSKVAILKHAVPWNETLLFFADSCQFVLSKTDLLTPKTVSITLTTSFDTDLTAKPVGAGQNVYFATAKGNASGLREYYVDVDSRQNDATEITAHVPTYIPLGLYRLAASTVQNILVALTAGAPNVAFVYKYFWNGTTKLQSAWSRWEFAAGDTVLSCDLVGTSIVFVISRADGCYLETMAVAGTDPVLLDRRLTPAQAPATYDPAANVTNITLPWTPASGDTYQIVAWTGGGEQDYAPGQRVVFTASGRTLAVAGRLTGYFVGLQYTFRYRFSPLVVREQSTGGTTQAMLSGRLQVRNVTVSYAATGYFRAEVTPASGTTYRYVLDAQAVLGGLDASGLLSAEGGSFRFPIMSKNDRVTIDLVNDSHLPCAFLSAEWEGFLQLRSKRI